MSQSLSRFTRRGWVFTSLGGALTIAAILIGQRDMLRAGILLLVLPLASLVIVVRSRIRLRATRRVDPPRIPIGARCTVHVELSNDAHVPTGAILVEDTLPLSLGSRPRFVLNHLKSQAKRNVTYHFQPTLRGQYQVGPLSARITDPFGLIEMRRSFSDTRTLIVTPTVWDLPQVRLVGEWSGSGEARPRAIATAGEEDATVRAYRDGDDMRRVHWRSTAHHGELMVRREEQPWQSRASVLLDTRESGHTGEGPDSSIEWAVSAAGSIGLHLIEHGYSVRLLTEYGETAPPDSSFTHTHESVNGQTHMLDSLAMVTANPQASVAHWPDVLARPDSATGMLIAILGRLEPSEAHIVARLHQKSTAALAILMDVASWSSKEPDESERVRETEVAQILRRGGWSVAAASRNDQLTTVWERLGLQRTSGPEARDAA